MKGISPYSYMQQVAKQMGDLNDRREIETVLDELEYLFEVIPPDFQDTAEQLIAQLRKKLAEAE